MPATVRFDELQERVRFLGDFPSSRVITPARLKAELNASLRKVYTLLADRRPDRYVEQASPVTVLAGSTSVSLPSSFFRLRLVWVLDDDGKYRRVARHNLTVADSIGGGDSPRSLRYRMQGSVLQLVPTPTRSYSIVVFYIPAMTALVADADTFDGVQGYEELAVVDCICKLRKREGMPVSEWERERAQLVADIGAAAGDEDMGEPFPLDGGRDDIDDPRPWWVG